MAKPNAPNLGGSVLLVHVVDEHADSSDFGTAGADLSSAASDLDDAATALQAAADDMNAAVEYETVAAAQTAQVLGSTGAQGDYLKRLICIPASVSPGVVTVLDGATSINVFAGGSNSLLELKPFVIEIGLNCVNAAWKVTTGANISVIACGDFT